MSTHRNQPKRTVKRLMVEQIATTVATISKRPTEQKYIMI